MASNKMYTPLFRANTYLHARVTLQTMKMIMMIIKKSPAINTLTKKKCLSFLIFIFTSIFNIYAFCFLFSILYIIIQYEIYSYGRKYKHLSNTYNSIALDTRLLAQPYRPSQIELSRPLIQMSCRGLIRGLIRGPICFCPASQLLISPWRKKNRGYLQTIVKIKKVDIFLHILPYSNQNRTENTAQTLKYPFSYTLYLRTKWRQRQTIERHNVTTTS